MIDSKQLKENAIKEIQKEFEGKLEPEYIEKYIEATAEWLDDTSNQSISYVEFVDDWFSGHGATYMWLVFSVYGTVPTSNFPIEVFDYISPLTNYGDTKCQFIDEELSDDNIQNEDLQYEFLEKIDAFESEYYTTIQRNKISQYIDDINTTMEEIEKVCGHLIENDNFFAARYGTNEQIYKELNGREEYVLKDYFEECVLNEVPNAKDLLESNNFSEEFIETTFYFYSKIEDVLHEAVEELNLHAWKSGYCYENDYDYYFELTPELENKIVDKFKEKGLSDCSSVDLYDISQIMYDLGVEEDEMYVSVPFTLTGAKESLENKKQWLQLADKLTQEIRLYHEEEKKPTMKM